MESTHHTAKCMGCALVRSQYCMEEIYLLTLCNINQSADKTPDESTLTKMIMIPANKFYNRISQGRATGWSTGF